MSRNVVVVGDTILDRTVHCTVVGVSKEDDGCIVARQAGGGVVSLGGAAHVAAQVRAFGGGPLFLTGVHVGCKHESDVDALLDRAVGDYEAVRHAWGGTAVKTRYYSGSGLLFRLDEGPGTPGPSDGIVEAVDAALSDGDVLCVADYGKGLLPCPAGREIAQRAAAAAAVLVDPGTTLFTEYTRGDNVVLKLNLKQASRFSGEWPNYDQNVAYSDEVYMAWCAEYVEYLWAIRDMVRCACVVVTFGAGGCAVFNVHEHDYTLVRSPRPSRVCDPCGAGDTFLARLCVDTAAAAKPLAIDTVIRNCERACLAAGIAVRSRGVTVVSGEEFEKELVA
jgi:bifunctional ADP-heptose synthase (sugar kinase/adenylyltransferase)